MKRVRLMKTMAGPAGVNEAGTVLELPDDEASQFVNGRHGVVVEDAESTEKRSTREKATKPSK